jgi:GNAT superfamily N-acetyltransferase
MIWRKWLGSNAFRNCPACDIPMFGRDDGLDPSTPGMEFSMQTEMRFDCRGVDWKRVSDTLKQVGMAYYEPDVHKRAFENSHTVVFVYHGDRLIGFGRAISDDAYQAAVYDVAILPEFQGRGIGSAVVRRIMSELPQCNFILYTFPGKEDFYGKLGWRKMKTGMAFFRDAETTARKGFTE